MFFIAYLQASPALLFAGSQEATSVPATASRPPKAFDGSYPRLFVTADQRDDLRHQVAEVDFKKRAFDSIVESLRPYVERHQKDPQWILSRIPMNRESGKRYIGYIMRAKKEGVAAHIEGYGDAPVPTLRFEGNAINGYHTAVYSAAPLDDLTPNGTENFNVLITDPTTRKKTLTQVASSIACLTFRETFEQIETMGRRSAYVYWITGDEKYARFAADILQTIADAVAVMKPLTVEPGGPKLGRDELYQVGNIFTNQALGTNLAQGMDYLHDYLVRQNNDLHNYEVALKTIASLSPASSNPHNISVGGNLTNLQLALIMSGDKEWSQPYLESTLNGITAQASHLDKNGVWIEPCAYSDYTIAWFMRMLWIGYNNHMDLLTRFPQILKSGTSQLRDLFPNCVYMGDGDDWSPHPRVWVIEPALTIAHRTGNTEQEKQLSQYISLMLDNGIYKAREDIPDPLDAINIYVPHLPYPSTGMLSLAPSIRNDTRQSIALRNIPQPDLDGGNAPAAIKKRNKDQAEYGLQATMYGTMQGLSHRHQQGITLDLYGRGNALGLDPGPGDDAYDGPIHNGFNRRWAAHNTVVVDGASTGWPDMTDSVMEPAEGVVPASTSFSFMKGDCVDPTSKKNQQRIVLVVRTSPTSGYYVDLYRSAGTGKNEYLYHNVGQNFDVLVNGKPATPHPAPDELNDDANHKDPALVGYKFFQDKQTFPVGEGDVQVRFNTPYNDQLDPVHMMMFMLGSPDRTLISATTPAMAAHRAYGGYVDQPIPTVIFRQKGEAWDRPFVAVFEPYRGEHQTVQFVSQLNSSSNHTPFTGLIVDSPSVPGVKGAIRDEFFTSTEPTTRNEGRDWAFKGRCGAMRAVKGAPVELYLGSGTELTSGNYALLCQNVQSADLQIDADQKPVLNSSGEIRVTLPLSSKPTGTAPTVKLVEQGRELPVTDIKVSIAPSTGQATITGTFPATHGGMITVVQ